MSFSSEAQAPLHRAGGNLALDFANTISWRGTRNETDHIGTPAALRRWAADSGLLDQAGSASSLPDTCLATAHALRDAIRSVMEAVLAGQEAADARSVLVRILRDALGSAVIAGSPAGFRFHGACDAILGPVALAAVDLLRGEQLARLKICPRDECHWLFLDLTRNRSRRWCDMAACGNRAKAEQHRHRHRPA